MAEHKRCMVRKRARGEDPVSGGGKAGEKEKTGGKILDVIYRGVRAKS